MGDPPHERVISSRDIALISLSARLLFENGQTTHQMVVALEQIGRTFGFRVTVFPRWGELAIRIDDDHGPHYEIIAAAPLGVDMRKVAATTAAIEQFCDGRISAEEAHSQLEAVTHFPPVSLARFVLLAGAGAAALGEIFGATHDLTLLIIALSAGAGAALRRWLAGISRNAFIQPFSAALLAGIIGAIAVPLGISSALRLVAICPCMILVPGPHLLNGAIDLLRARITLGVARVGYASLITFVISLGLLIGLSVRSVDLPVSGPQTAVPLGYDVIAAGIAVGAYGTFFAMPWRTLPIPIAIGMLAHALRWAVITWAGASVEVGALVACLLVGVLVTPIGHRLRLPFGALAFASVVSLIPGAYLFRMTGGLMDILVLGRGASFDLLLSTIVDGMTALLIMIAMTLGLIVPKMILEYLFPALAEFAPHDARTKAAAK